MKRKKFEGGRYDEILKSTRTYYAKFSESYVKFYENWLKRQGVFSDPEYREGYETVAKFLVQTAKSGDHVIDIGCGIGVWSALLAEKNVYVTGLDNLRMMLQKCADGMEEFELKSRISLLLSDGFCLPFRDEAFDGATLNWVLAHIPKSRNIMFMSEVSRIVRHNGWLFISDSYWRGQEGGKEQAQIREIGGDEYEVYKYYYDRSELKQLVEKTFGEIQLLQPLQYELICLVRKR